MVAMGRKLEALEKPKAKERKTQGQTAGGKARHQLGDDSSPSRREPRTRTKVAKALGVAESAPASPSDAKQARVLQAVRRRGGGRLPPIDLEGIDDATGRADYRERQ